MQAIDLAAAIRLAGPASEWASGTAMNWTTDSDDVLALLAQRRAVRNNVVPAAPAGEENEPASEAQLEPARYSGNLASLVLRECGWNTALEALLTTNHEALEPALTRLLARALTARILKRK